MSIKNIIQGAKINMKNKKKIIIYVLCIILVILTYLLLFPLAKESPTCCWNECDTKPLIHIAYLNIISIILLITFIGLIIKNIIKK